MDNKLLELYAAARGYGSKGTGWQSDLANELGVSVATVSYWKNGKRNMPREKKLAISQLIDDAKRQ